MFLDAIVSKEDPREVLYNAPVAATCRYVLSMDLEMLDKVYVISGDTLEYHTPIEYLNRHNLVRDT